MGTSDPPTRPALPSPAGSKHLPVLDGIRGLAILLVMIHHFLAMPGDSALGRCLNALSGSGWIGVDLFFVLSGFLITGILADTRDAPGYFRNFYARRALRIFPLYYLYLCLYLACTRGDLTPQVPHEAAWVACYGTNILISLKQTFIAPPLTHFWSLAIEEHFYLLWPLLVFLFPPKQMLRVCLVFILAALCSRSLFWWFGSSITAYVLTPCRVDGFAIGGFIALLLRQPQGLTQLLPLARWIGAAAVAILALAFAPQAQLESTSPFMLTVGLTLLAVAFGSLIVSAVAAPPRSRLHRLMTAPPLRFLGKYSYALYVFHWPIHLVISDWVMERAAWWRPQAFGNTTVDTLLSAAIGVVLSLAAAWASWHLFEKHFLKLKRHFEPGITPPIPPITQMA